VVVKREKNKDFSAVKVIGNEKRVTLAYSITVKNTQNKAIRFILKEQYPLSSRKEIEVQVNEADLVPAPTLNNKELGVVTWEIDLQAGESKVFKLSYSVKYPKDKQVGLE
jgi:hypothetical protein